MKRFLFLLVLVCTMQGIHAQYVYTIKADSVKITNSCDTAELIIENHTQTVPGFLFNKGRGRTEFRRGLLRSNDSVFVIGGDTLRMNPWLQGGNRFGTTGTFGTMDNNSIDFYTNGLKRGRLTYEGNWLIGNVARDDNNVLQVGGRGSISFNPNLSRTGDRIAIGGWLNQEDGQNYIIRASSDNGLSYRTILYERDGLIGIGTTSLSGSGALKVFPGGLVNIASGEFFMGTETAAYNTSQLKMYVSDPAEFLSGPDVVHNPDNYYFLGTSLTAITGNNVRANLRLSGRQLNFYSGLGTGTEAGRFTEAGHLVLGSDQDYSQILQVHGTARIWDSLLVQGRFIQGYTQVAQLGNGLVFDIAYNRARIGIDGGMVYEARNSGDQHLFENPIGIQNTGAVMVVDPGGDPRMPEAQPCFRVNGQVQQFVVTVKGRTGIGTLSPSAQLHTTGTVRFEGLTNDSALSRIVVCDASGNLSFREYSTFVFNKTLNSDLAVNGTVSAQKMLISQTSRWPDYVFSKKYQLPSLAEVENFINQNNHLPGIPSAAEVEKKGIDVASNQAGLLKKIEELTLYAIEQEKKLQKQSGEIMGLNEEINELKNQNKEMESLKQQIAELRTLIISISQSKK